MLEAGELRLAGSVEIDVEDRHGAAARAQRLGQLQGQRALADAAFARADRQAMAHARQALGDALAQAEHLLENLRAAVALDVEVGLHGWAEHTSAAPAAAPLFSSRQISVSIR